MRRVDATTGIITRHSGTGTAGYSGDGGQALLAQMNGLHGVAVAADGSILICERNGHRIRRVDPSGISVLFKLVFFATHSNFLRCASFFAVLLTSRFFSSRPAAGIITTVAGTGTVGSSTGDGGPATAATLNDPNGVAAGLGAVYVAENRVRGLVYEREREEETCVFFCVFQGWWARGILLVCANTRQCAPRHQ